MINDFKSNNDNEKTFFDEDIDKEIKTTPKTTMNDKVVHTTKKLQASYNNNVKKLIKETAQEKSANLNLNFLIDLAMVASRTIQQSLEPPLCQVM